MNRLRQWRLTREILVRVVADVIMLNGALLLALIARYLWSVDIQSGTGTPRAILAEYAKAYVGSAWLLTGLSVAVFLLHGFYTHGRAYSGRFKALMIVQAITASYLVFVFASYISGGAVSLPRAVTPVAWALTVILLVGARLWATLWITMARPARRRTGAPAARDVKQVLVIGGDGYIGSALLPKLLAKGYHVRVLGLLLYGTEPIRDVLNHPRLEVMRADFRQVDKVVEAMRDVDAVVHLGAIVGDPACALDQTLTIDVNLMATRMIAEVAKGAEVERFIFASTCSVYGASDEVLDEHSALRPLSLYAQSKIACERILTGLADETFAPVILRFGTVYGLSGRIRFDLVVNLLTAKAVVDGAITVVGGDQWRPFVHVDDAASAIAKALEAPLVLVRNEVFNVGSEDQNYTIAQVGALIHKLVPTAQLLTYDSDGDRRNYRVSVAKIRGKLGFVAAWTVEQGVQQVIDALRSGKVGDYRAAKYSNVKFLSEQGIKSFGRHDGRWAYDLLSEWSVAFDRRTARPRLELESARAGDKDLPQAG